jgi:hypothetical protein
VNQEVVALGILAQQLTDLPCLDDHDRGHGRRGFDHVADPQSVQLAKAGQLAQQCSVVPEHVYQDVRTMPVRAAGDVGQAEQRRTLAVEEVGVQRLGLAVVG